MEIKYTLLGALIYAAMAAWLFAFVACLFKSRRTGTILLAAGAAVMAAAFVVHWIDVEHAPFQNLFDVVLFMSVVAFPLTMFCEQVLGVRGLAAWSAFLGLVLLVPLGFVNTPRFTPEPQVLPPALQSWLFVPHVGIYMIAYFVLLLAMAPAVLQLVKGCGPEGLEHEQASYRMVRLGLPLLTLGLLLGAVWGKLAWGDYWHWDPKELWSLASFLVYLVYLHLRSQCGPRFARLNSILVLTGAALVVMTLLWLNLGDKLFPGLHVYAMQ